MKFDRRLPVALLHHQCRENDRRNWKNVYVLLHEKKLSGLQAMLPVLEAVGAVGQAASDHAPKTSKAKRWRRWS